jgi:hypothetical protein
MEAGNNLIVVITTESAWNGSGANADMVCRVEMEETWP